jgi:hypothetical protein
MVAIIEVREDPGSNAAGIKIHLLDARAVLQVGETCTREAL